jgi:hypothetical protein
MNNLFVQLEQTSFQNKTQGDGPFVFGMLLQQKEGSIETGQTCLFNLNK